ncbi:MAG: 4-hydroxy-3-methylbut-2-enyl diphosphate reductase, partial [Chloroflexi bacterium]|nr:4-hydroxy-3-methylbut-2-enyl diphosphate reductase [Chloroflexota bacterium]
HDLVRALAARGYDIIYIGKKGHPEPEGVLGEAPGRVRLVESEADVAALAIGGERVAVTTQTTLSKWDTERLLQLIRQRYPHVEVYNEICDATQRRQEAAVAQSHAADLVIVVGDRRSNNSNRLVEVVTKLASRPAYLIDNAEELRPEWLVGVRRVAVTSGSSTPSEITREVIRRLEAWPVEVTTAAVG